MKLLVFAHVPPPHHGQSYMVQLMLEGFGGDWRRLRGGTRAGPSSPLGVECYHVNARLSQKLEDIGDFRISKFLLLIGYCVQAIWCRFRYGVTNLYYIPAPGKRSALYRDWLVMFLCRPFYKRIILHWHAAGLAKWLETVMQIQSRSLTYRLLKRVDLSIVLSQYNKGDAEKLFARRIAVVGNGIPDPCPEFATAVLPRRRARLAARLKLLAGQALSRSEVAAAGGDPQVFRVLFLAHCTREKGLFDTIEAAALARRALVDARSPLSLELMVAGDFISPAEREEFDRRLAELDPNTAEEEGRERSVDATDSPPPVRPPLVRYIGFVYGEAKNRVLAEADCFCFPTYYYAESFGLVLVESMAFGLPLITTPWRSIPELLPEDYPGLVPIHRPAQVADKLQAFPTLDMAESLRERFVAHFTFERHLAGLAAALHALDQPMTEPDEPSPRLCESPAR